MNTDRWEANPRMLAQCSDLVGVMQEQERVCRRLLDLITEERSALTSGQMGRLEPSTAVKGHLIDRMELLQRRQQVVAERLARKLSLPVNTPAFALVACVRGQHSGDEVEPHQRGWERVGKPRDLKGDFSR
jgi:hypothetical protein